jgi:putative colanic acid biosynthesis acetyltransferase WcaB
MIAALSPELASVAPTRAYPGTVRVALALRALAVRARVLPQPLRIPAKVITSALYRTYALGFVGMDLPTRTSIGFNFVVHHGIGLVVHADTVIGTNVTLRQNTTIGKADESRGAPVIGSNVEVGANVVILGPITIGDGAVIGAGSVVVKDVRPGARVVGNPAREL